LKFATWNVNGIRACLDKSLVEYALFADAEIIALQETKVNEPIQIDDLLSLGYSAEWNFAERLGYSGTLTLFTKTPTKVTHGLDNKKFDNEGRLITLEYPSFYFLNVYVPNSIGGRERWYYRLEWDGVFLEYVQKLQKVKPIIIGGDLNVARDYIDVYPENLRNEENPPGFLSEERDGLNALFDLGLVDVFRHFHPTKERAYSWWSQRGNKRSENRGWRLDYFLVSESLMPKVGGCVIRSDILGSDHAPVELEIDLWT